MAVTYLEISYPNFVLGAIIDPEEANQNNHEFVTKINQNIVLTNTNETKIADLYNIKADKTLLTSTVNQLAGVGRTTETVRQNSLNLITHKTSIDHDTRYYTKTLLDTGQLDNRYYTEVEMDGKLSLLATKAENNLKANSADVYTREELVPWLRGGDTSIKEEVYTIVTSNNGDGTFNYTDGTNPYVGEIDINGYQIFTLRKGIYELNTNRIELIVNDTLRRSVASGGAVEISKTKVGLTSPEGAGAEITIKYYERMGLAAEYNIKLSSEKPPQNNGKNMWFKLIG